jgi:hypothetical protein
MASLNAAAALTALADVDVELPVNGLARDLDLKRWATWASSRGPPQPGQWSGR